MSRLALILVVLFAMPTIAVAQEYCYNQYEGQIQNVSAELGGDVKRISQIDVRMAQIFTSLADLSGQLASAAGSNPPDIPKLQSLGTQIGALNVERTNLQAEAYQLQDRVAALKGVIPADLQGRLRGCIDATAPANKLVNLTIQTLAILSTGGASLLLPSKALYIDMSEVLNGYPTGGPNSVINEAREAALRALPFGLGSADNDFGKTVRDPGRIIRCIWGC